jgi:hypothetical protein
MSDQDAVLVRVVVTDTNILINLIHVGLLNLLGKLPPYSFVIPEEVVREIKDPDQGERRASRDNFQSPPGYSTDRPCRVDRVRGAYSYSRHRRSSLLKLGAMPKLANRL